MVGERGPDRRGEEPVGKRVVLRPRPVRLDVGAMELGERVLVGRVRLVEPVHQTAVDRRDVAVVAMRQVVGALQRRPRDRPLHAVVVGRRRAVRAGIRAEDVVEAPVLQEQEHHVLDRRARRVRARIDGGRQRPRHRIGRRVQLLAGLRVDGPLRRMRRCGRRRRRGRLLR